MDSPSPAALSDYQMQLMLLEQQNKKRLCGARSENAAPPPGPPSGPSHTSPAPMRDLQFQQIQQQNAQAQSQSQQHWMRQQAMQQQQAQQAQQNTMRPPPPPRSVSTSSSDSMDVEMEPDVVIRNITISRDATTGSGFEQEKLMALQKSSNKAAELSKPSFLPPPPPPAMNLGMMPPPPPQMLGTMMPPQPPHYPYPVNTGGPPPPPPGQPFPPQRGPPPKRLPTGRKRPNQDEDAYSRLAQRIRTLEEENDELKAAQGIEKKPPRYQVFHTIQNDPKTYLEPPTWELNSDDEWRLKGHLPVQSKARFLQTRRDIMFSVEKSYSSEPLDEETKRAINQGAEAPESKASSEKIVFETTEMTEAMTEFVEQNPALENQFDDFPNVTQLRAPYLFWYGCRSPTALDNLEPRHQELMKLVVGCIEEACLAEWQKADELFESGLVSMATMPYLVKPGEVVVAEHEGQHFAVVAYSWAYTRAMRPLKDLWQSYMDKTELSAPKSIWTVSGWAYNFDGELYKKGETCELSLTVRTEDEEVKMEKLSFYPLRFATPEIKEKLENRGRMYWTCCRAQKLVSYQEDDGDAAQGTGERIMLDYKTYLTVTDKSTSRSMGRQYISQTFSDQKMPEAPHIYLFPPKVTGYKLRSKSWITLQVDRISEVVWNKQAFEHLVVEPGTKELVQALVTNQIVAEKSTDLIQNKGNGLIMLLHGGPGTGKTFTAESVAELAEKPLFRVTCGDVGTDPEEVEKYLESVLYLGKIWGCVVLLDEADVFLEQRTLNDLTRNALVSVFLRILEYHDGILILTSNRVGNFDEAFKSRIQLALHYDSLNRKQRSQIWSNFLTRLKNLGEKNIDYIGVEGYIKQLADHPMNGREIRNAITTARQLAQFQNKDMTYEHLKHVIAVARKFDQHLGSMRGPGGASEAGDGVGAGDDETTMSRYTWADWKKLNVDDRETPSESP